MGVGAGLYMYVVVVQKFTFAISSPDEFLYISLETVLEEDFRTVCYKFFTSPAGTVAKYGDEYVCLCVSVCLSLYVFVPGRIPILLHGPGCNLSEW